MLQFGTWHRYFCDKIIMPLMKYKEEWKGTIKNSLKDIPIMMICIPVTSVI